MIKRLLQANREQRKLLVSVGANFLTRIPGVVGLLWFLPLLRFGLGTDEYASLLTSMALASASAFLAGGFNMIGRRLVGQAYGNGDRTGESNGLASVVVANTIAIIPTLIVIGTYCWICSSSLAFLIVSSLSAIGLYLAVFDNVRAAYNENYVNAILLIVFQTIAYAIGFFVPATRHSLVLGSLVLQSPYWLVSLVTLVLLVRERPYLVHGRAVAVWPVVRDGTRLAIADGFLMATLSLAVVWLQRSGNAMISAWFATVVRLFQTLLMPVVLLLIPLSSYIRIVWSSKSAAQQRAYTRVTLLSGLAYGTLVAVLIFVASRLYVDRLLHLRAAGGLSVFFLFGVIVAYKSYSSIAYLVLEETVHLSSWTTVATSAAIALGAVASVAIDPMSAINVFALAAALFLIIVLFWNAARFVPGSLEA